MPLDDIAIAWIVAVEKYDGPELDIKQPVAGWALDFADLMLNRGCATVVLSTSLSDVPAYAPRLLDLQNKGVVQTPADRAGIEFALDAIKGDGHTRPGGTLFFYWVGHGIMAPSRQLLCADSKKLSDLRSVTADSLLKRLRSPEFPRLQIGFFECCAQLVAVAPATLDLGGEGKAPTRQFFYHAASSGEFATGSTDKPGFSSTVLQALKGSATFPPEPPDAFFDSLKTSLGAIPLQTRPFLQRTYESGDVWSSGDPAKADDVFDAARVAELALSQFDHLWHSLRSANLKPIEIARAWRDERLPEFLADLRAAQPLIAAPDLFEKAAKQLRLQRHFEPLCLRLRLLFRDWLAVYDRVVAEDLIGKPERTEDLPQLMLSALDQMNPEFGLRSFIKLAEMAARRARKQEPEASDALCRALAAHPRLAPLYQGVIEALPVENGPLYLLLSIDWDRDTQTASLAEAWTYPGVRGGCDKRELAAVGKLAQQINNVAQAVIKEFPERPLRVEMLAPNELLCTPRELLELVDTELEVSLWLEERYPITLRWRNRMIGKDNTYLPGSWKQFGRAVRSSADKAASLACVWRPDSAAVGTCHVVGLSFAGPCPSDLRRNKPQFFAELLKGAPYMCWPRNPPQDIESFKRAAAELFGKSQLKSLPIVLLEGRSNVLLRDLLSDLVVLIDDPDRNPWDSGNNLTETAQRGTE